MSVSLFEEGEQFATKQASQHGTRQEVIRSAGDPAVIIPSESSGGNQAVQMGMVLQVLAPGVKHGEDADASAEESRIGGQFEQGLGDSTKQQGVHQSLISQCQRSERLGQGEDDMGVRHRQKTGGLFLEPAIARRGLTLGTVAITAGQVGDGLV